MTPLQLEADRFSVEKEQIVLETAQTKLNVLRNFTRAKMVSTLDADIKTADANLRSQEATHALDVEKLNLIRSQIKKCEILAPADGQVVYANSDDDDEIKIEEGAMVRERQVLFRFPDPNKMQVRAKINEARIARISEGMTATVQLDAFPDREIHGTVRSVDEYPLPSSWRSSSSSKQYATFIDILDPPLGMRPGMTAEVRIKIEQIPEALQLPVQAVVEHGNEHFCLLPTANSLEVRKITIGSSNGKSVVIHEGLSPQEVVVTNPRAHLEQVSLPKIVEPKLPTSDIVAQASGGDRELTKSGDE